MSDFLEAIRKRGIGALDKKMGIEIIEASPERLVGTMPVEVIPNQLDFSMAVLTLY